MSGPVFFGDASDLAAASAAARRTFKLFWRELSWEYRRIVPAYDVACVKLAFEQEGEVEHMWVGDVRFDGQKLRGTLLNEPNQVRSVHAGDAVDAVLGPRLGDWMLAHAGQVLGAYTVQAMRARMGDRERAEHDGAWGLDFGPPDRVRLPPEDDDHPMALNMLPSLEEFLAKNPGQAAALDDEGLTLLHREALAGNACVVAVLLAHGVPVNARSGSGRTALALARRLGGPKVEATLVQAGGTERAAPRAAGAPTLFLRNP